MSGKMMIRWSEISIRLSTSISRSRVKSWWSILTIHRL